MIEHPRIRVIVVGLNQLKHSSFNVFRFGVWVG